MPLIQIITEPCFWRKYNAPYTYIELDSDESISDEVLSIIPADINSVLFTYNKATAHKDIPLHFTCSAEALGKCNLKSIIFGGNLDEIDDSIFQYCKVLERIWIGRSTKPILDHAPNLLKCPIIAIGIMGWGKVEGAGRDLQMLFKSIGDVECVV
jgi:hypothetical protein